MTKLKREIAILFRWSALIVVVWTLIVMAALFWSLKVEYQHTIQEVVTEAQAHFNKDKAFRLWGTSHGGVYVPVDEHTPPNPHLAHIPDRDITSSSGKKLTLMNPAYMVRQMMTEYEDLFGVKGKITSFPDKLFNPKNMPDAWELSALNAFAQGKEEMKEIAELNGVQFMRLMRPMFVSQGCLKCHATQGYQVGDLRGGVGVAVPMTRYLKHEAERQTLLSVSYLFIWLVGLAGIYGTFRAIRRRAVERIKLTEKLRRINSRLEKYSYQDGLTQIANRRMFDALLKREWAAAKRNGYPLSLIMIDVDYFKGFNDGYGHHAGDICLSRIATTLNGVSRRTTDLLARYGGEEFVLLLPNTGEKQAERIANHCHRDVAAMNIPHDYSDAADIVTISVGVTTTLPGKDDDIAMLVEMADQMMYRAKNSGRNRVVTA